MASRALFPTIGVGSMVSPGNGPKRPLGQAKCASRGFTLLEILVAFTVMAVLLTTLLQVFSGGLRAAQLGEQYTRAVLLAQSKMAALEADEDALALGVQTGNIDEIFQWHLSVSAYPTEAYPRLQELNMGFYPVTATVVVTWQADGRQRSVALSTLRLVSSP